MSHKTVDYVSASQVSTFLECPVQYKYIYVDGKPRMADNIYTGYGSAIHEALAYNYKQKIKSKKDRDVDDIEKFFEKALKKEYAKLECSEIVYNEMLMTGKLVLYAYMREIAPFVQPAYVEQKFELPLSQFPITILGYIDLITDDGVIIDHKTAGKTYKRQWNFQAAQKSVQGAFYAAAYRKQFGKKEAHVRFDILPRMPKPEFLQLIVYKEDKDVLNSMKLATAIEKVVKKGVFTPNYNSCGQCPFNGECTKLPIIE